MHKITGDKDVVHSLLKDSIAQLERSAPKPKKTGPKPTSMSDKGVRKTPQSQNVIDVWQQGLDRLESSKGVRATRAKRSALHDERGVKSMYAPRDQIIALFQSAMEEYLDKAVGPAPPDGPAGDAKKSSVARKTSKVAAAKKAAKGPATIDVFYKGGKAPRAGKKTKGVDHLAQFSNLDPRWIQVVTEKAKVIFKGKHAFITHKSASDFRFRMDNETTVAIVGDWGGGNAAAQAVAKQIQRLHPRHVIHLGDVYYAGTPKEVKERFLKFWPRPKTPGRSFALNSNHEMYSGGYGYFDTTLKEFQQPASYFSLANDNWRLIGLDTGYDEHDLKDPQANWLKSQVTGGAKNILLSHHQLFSAFETTDASSLRAKVQDLLGNIYAWIWGHEHLAVVYEEHDGIKGVCLGNGCFPYNLPKKKPAVAVKWLDKRQGIDPDYRGGHTFALLRLQGPRIDIDFIDHQGNIGNTETWE